MNKPRQDGHWDRWWPCRKIFCTFGFCRHCRHSLAQNWVPQSHKRSTEVSHVFCSLGIPASWVLRDCYEEWVPCDAGSYFYDSAGRRHLINLSLVLVLTPQCDVLRCHRVCFWWIPPLYPWCGRPLICGLISPIPSPKYQAPCCREMDVSI